MPIEPFWTARREYRWRVRGEFEEVLGVRFRDAGLLRLALVHSSFLNENPGGALESNERLEYLGDAVLGMVVAEELYAANARLA